MTTASENVKPVTAYCRVCGKALTEETVRLAQGTVYCEDHVPPAAEPRVEAAGVPVAPVIANPGVSPGLAFVLGLIPGVGAIYNGQYAKGVVHVLIFGLLISIMSSDSAGGLEPMFGMLTGVFYFYMAFEAYHTARKRMAGEPVDEFSSLVQMDTRAGRVPLLPLALIALGVLFLLNNLGVFYLGQLLKFWPVLMILAGVYMLYVRMSPGKRDEENADQGGGER
jgi:TM2 domain-containing membrane protein YozV